MIAVFPAFPVIPDNPEKPDNPDNPGIPLTPFSSPIFPNFNLFLPILIAFQLYILKKIDFIVYFFPYNAIIYFFLLSLHSDLHHLCIKPM